MDDVKFKIPKSGQSLQDKYPEIASQWNYKKNGLLKPDMISYGTRKKVWWKCEKGHEWQATINSRTSQGTGCPYCFGGRVISGVNDLATLHPNLIDEWNYERNGDLLPSNISCGSGKKVWWKCEKGHEWQARVSHRCNGIGCPICAGHQVLKGYNDLATTKPELVKEWDYEKNNELGVSPDKVTYGSGIKVWWKCENGHEWKTAICMRTRGNGCPICANQQLLVGYNDLETTHPELAKEWNYEKNKNLLPSQVTFGSSKKVWWKCSQGHEWETIIAHRVNKYTGCPICSNKKVLEGYNDFKSTHPFLAEEWDYEKNGKLTPNMFSYGSTIQVWWKCKTCGYEWKTSINNRTQPNGTGCPNCASIYGTSFSEQAVYYFLNLCFPYKVYNRYKLKDKNGVIEVDIFLSDIKTAIEYDGEYWHRKRKNYDKVKEDRLKALKIKLFRIVESNVNRIVDNCIFYDFFKNHYENLTWAINSLFGILGIGSLSVDVKANFQEILSLFYKNELSNSLAFVNPKLAKEWHPTKNGTVTPSMIKPFSNLNVWWKCSKCGHEWQASVGNRNQGRDCPLCKTEKMSKSLSKVRLNNSLQEKFPQVAKEWNYERNGTLTPDKINFGSNRKVWWKCSKGHEWQAVVGSRCSGIGCPVCSGHQVLAGYNDLKTTLPQVAKEWNYERNGSLLPSQVTYGSNKKVWWKCHICGYEWQAVISSRRNGVGCPECGKKRAALIHSTPKRGESLEDKFQRIANEWNYEKNKEFLPSQVTCSSNKKVWWKCSECGHEWEATVNSRTGQGSGCPKCSKIRRKKTLSMPKSGQSLQDKCPDLAKEWNYEKNGELLPSQVTCSSNKKVWWKCSECGHEWEAIIGNRNKGRGCPSYFKLRRKGRKPPP